MTVHFFFRIALVLLTAIFFSFLTDSVSGQDSQLWPDKAWPVSTPDEQGVNSSVLDTLIMEMEKGVYGMVDAFMLIRNGYVIANERFDQDYEAIAANYDTTNYQYNYDHPEWHPYLRGSELHSLQSVTKSVTSAALGIAVDQGFLEGAQQFVKPIFTKFEPYPMSAWRDSIRLEDFLTMRSGIQWKTDVTYESGEHSTNLLEASYEWIPFVLSQPMDTIPGVVFEYNDGVSVLLGEIVRQATGTRLDKWTEKQLFEPIGIDEYYWKITPSGEVDSEGGLYLSTEDLARVGYLILRNGNWNGKQVISEQWVKESTRPVIPNVRATLDDGFSLGYGYQWWIPALDSNPIYTISGNGYGGQFLFIVPDLDLVVVFNGWNIHETPDKSTYAAFLNLILPAVK